MIDLLINLLMVIKHETQDASDFVFRNLMIFEDFLSLHLCLCFSVVCEGGVMRAMDLLIIFEGVQVVRPNTMVYGVG